MPVVDPLKGRSIPPEKLTRTPADHNVVRQVVRRVNEVKETAEGNTKPYRVSNTDALHQRQHALGAAKQTVNIASWQLEDSVGLTAGSSNIVPFNVNVLSGVNGRAGSLTDSENFLFNPPHHRLGIYRVYYYVALTLNVVSNQITTDLQAQLFKNGSLFRSGDWATVNNSGDGTYIENAALQMSTLVELSSCSDYIEARIYSGAANGSQTCTWTNNPATSSVYGYIDIEYLGCNIHNYQNNTPTNSHNRI